MAFWRHIPTLLLGVLVLAPACDRVHLCGDSDGDGSCDEFDACPFHPAEPETGALVRGTVVCQSLDNTTETQFQLASLPVHSRFGDATTDCAGAFAIPVADAATLTDGPVDVSYYYDSEVLGPNRATTRLRVMDDLEVAWGASPFHTGFFRTLQGTRTTVDGRTVLELEPLVIKTSECEAWRIGTVFVDDYHNTSFEPVPGGFLQYMRRSAVFDTTPYAFYDHVDLASNILALYPDRFDRELTLFHESGHIVRDVLDGDLSHWNGDNVNYRYARCHTGTEIFEEPFAFHEGWADYWMQARRGGRARLSSTTSTTAYCGLEAGPNGLTLTPDHLDWVETLIADHLLDLAECVGDGTPAVGDREMLRTLEDNRGSIHSMWEFEEALCAAHDCCGLDRTEAPPKCPPGYEDDGLSCRGFGYVIRHYRG
ncbi:MAG: hypothetical protein ABMB14_13800 [Myxococcota bacterium]